MISRRSFYLTLILLSVALIVAAVSFAGPSTRHAIKAAKAAGISATGAILVIDPCWEFNTIPIYSTQGYCMIDPKISKEIEMLFRMDFPGIEFDKWNHPRTIDGHVYLNAADKQDSEDRDKAEKKHEELVEHCLGSHFKRVK